MSQRSTSHLVGTERVFAARVNERMRERMLIRGGSWGQQTDCHGHAAMESDSPSATWSLDSKAPPALTAQDSKWPGDLRIFTVTSQLLVPQDLQDSAGPQVGFDLFHPVFLVLPSSNEPKLGQGCQLYLVLVLARPRQDGKPVIWTLTDISPVSAPHPE